MLMRIVMELLRNYFKKIQTPFGGLFPLVGIYNIRTFYFQAGINLTKLVKPETPMSYLPEGFRKIYIKYPQQVMMRIGGSVHYADACILNPCS